MEPDDDDTYLGVKNNCMLDFNKHGNHLYVVLCKCLIPYTSLGAILTVKQLLSYLNHLFCLDWNMEVYLVLGQILQF